MITDAGKLHIKRYMAGFVPNIAQSICFGVGNSSTTAGHTRLDFETSRVNIELTSLDVVNNKIIYKASLPENFSGTVREVGIYSVPSNSVAGQFGSRILTTFDPTSEDWVAEVGNLEYGTANTRVGQTSILHNAEAGGFETSRLSQSSLDLSGYSNADKFVLAFNSGNSNVQSIRLRLMTDGSNFYDLNLGPQGTGYRIIEATKSSASTTGSPRWDSINEIQLTTVSAAGAAASVEYDALRMEDVDTVNPEYILVAREILTTPYTKQQGKVEEVEFALGINV